ncbi:hypothetical protein TNCV_919591 [Trichonephila clavipes]|nr:hypothetical protein TNCV_919591 [Trichonephila clavipes]
MEMNHFVISTNILRRVQLAKVNAGIAIAGYELQCEPLNHLSCCQKACKGLVSHEFTDARFHRFATTKLVEPVSEESCH